MTNQKERIRLAKGIIDCTYVSLTSESQIATCKPLNIEKMRNSKTELNNTFSTLIACELMKSPIFQGELFHG